MIITIVVSSVVLNIVLAVMVYSLSKEKPSKKTKVIYKEKPVEKIVYKDRVVEKVVYKEKTVQPKIDPNKVIPSNPEMLKEGFVKQSKERLELLDALNVLKTKKKKTKKDLENIYTIEKVLPNIK